MGNIGWYDKSNEAKADDCDDCSLALEQAKERVCDVEVCPRCGHLFIEDGVIGCACKADV